MIRLKGLALIMLAIIFGFISSVGVYRYLKSQEELLKKSKPVMVKVVVANTNIKIGKNITSEDLTAALWPKEAVPKESFPEVGLVIGRIANRDILNSEPILEGHLVPQGGILGIIPEGMRAVSLSIDKASGVFGFIQPGSRVDILTTIAVGKDTMSRVILQNVKVLAATEEMEAETSRSKQSISKETVSITVALTPEEAEKLVLAINKGKIQLALRNFSDATLVQTGGITTDRLLTAGPEAEALAMEPHIATEVIEIIKGDERIKEKFGPLGEHIYQANSCSNKGPEGSGEGEVFIEE